VSMCSGGGLNGGSVNPAAVTGAGLMMLNGAVMNPSASGLLMPSAAAAGNAGVVMQRPVMLPSAASPAAGYLVAGRTGATAPALMPQYVVGYPQQTGVTPELAAAYGHASPYGVSMPSAAVYGAFCFRFRMYNKAADLKDCFL